jgi:YfiH family protein
MPQQRVFCYIWNMADELSTLPAFENLPGIRAFFTTRTGGRSEGPFASLNLGPSSGDDPETVRRNWAILLQAHQWGDHGLALPRLCHGSASAEVGGSPAAAGAGAPGIEPAEVDAVFTRSPEWVLAVTMADCLPALIADPVTRCVAAVHAGWRGTRDEILGRTLARLFAEGHCRPESTRVAFGPCLSPEALEISEDVAVTLPEGFVRRAEGRYHFDLRGANRAQALSAGVRPEFVSESGGCTRENPHLFFSYRRDAGRTGRMAACIGLI